MRETTQKKWITPKVIVFNESVVNSGMNPGVVEAVMDNDSAFDDTFCAGGAGNTGTVMIHMAGDLMVFRTGTLLTTANVIGFGGASNITTNCS